MPILTSGGSFETRVQTLKSMATGALPQYRPLQASWASRLAFGAQHAALRYGRYLLLLLILSLLFFSIKYYSRPAAPPASNALALAIDREIRALALREVRARTLGGAIDASLRRLALPASTGWTGAYWDWLWRWDKLRAETFNRVCRTILLALFCFAITLALGLRLTAALKSGERREKPPSPYTRIAIWALGTFPAYALVFVLADVLKYLRLGTWPLALAAVFAIAIGDGVLTTTVSDLHQAWRRLRQRDFMATVRDRLPPERLDRYLHKIALIDVLPHCTGRLTALIGTIVVVGIVPGLYRGTLGAHLNLHDPDIWLTYSLDALWVLALAMVALTLLTQHLTDHYQRDRKGLDRLSQILGEAEPVQVQSRELLIAAAALLACTLIAAGLHWRADVAEVAARLLLSLGAVVVGGGLGLALAVAIGILLPLYSAAASNFVLQCFESVPRVIAVAFLMTLFNLGQPDAGPVAKWLLWSALLGCFCFAEVARTLHGQIQSLQRVDFVDGLRSLGLCTRDLFRLHIWPQMKYRVHAGIYPLVRAIVFCEGAVCILRFAMKGVVIDLFPLGSLLAEGTEHFSFGAWRGILYGFSIIALLAACIEIGSRGMQHIWYQLFLRSDAKNKRPAPVH